MYVQSCVVCEVESFVSCDVLSLGFTIKNTLAFVNTDPLCTCGVCVCMYVCVYACVRACVCVCVCVCDYIHCMNSERESLCQEVNLFMHVCLFGVSLMKEDEMLLYIELYIETYMYTRLSMYTLPPSLTPLSLSLSLSLSPSPSLPTLSLSPPSHTHSCSR